MRRVLVWFLFLAVAGVARASLGDGADRIEDSYGNLVARHLRDDGMVAVVYHKDRYLFEVVFDREVSVSERYSRFDRRELSEKEIARFLKMNAGRKMWWSRNGSRFERSDHKAVATMAQGGLKVESGK